MQTNHTMEPTGSPVPGVIPDPVSVHHDTVAAHERLMAAPTPSDTTEPASSPGRRNPVSILLAKMLSAARGDKYLADAYPPAWRGPTAARDADDPVRQTPDGEVAVGVQSTVEPAPDSAGNAATATSQTKER